MFCLVGCNANSLPEEMPDDFSFSMTWGTFGYSSYDSKTGTLVKTTDATNPDDYVTTYILSEEELKTIYNLIRDLNIESYDDEFDSLAFNGSDPHLTLSLTVHTNSMDKTIKANEVASYNSTNTIKGKKYLDTVKAIRDILEGTDEWKALPDYEFYYD